MRISDWSSDVCSSDLFARLYPEQYAATVSGDQMYRDAQERWRNTLNGLQTTMQMQAQVSQNLGEDDSVLADLVGKSQSAAGALTAMQRSEERPVGQECVSSSSSRWSPSHYTNKNNSAYHHTHS